MTGLIITKLQKRAASALVLGPLAFAIVLYGGWPFFVFVLVLALLALFEWFGLARKMNHSILYMAVGFVYVCASFWCCYWIRVHYSPQMALLFLSMIWASDIGAYAFGKSLGGPKMAEHISPNKTWAGYGGALFSPALIAVLLSGGYLFVFNDGAYLNVVQVLLLVAAGVCVGLVGQSGDLIVSYLKRRAGVKDTGQLIPGHGGLLDRVDSLMLAAPVFLFFISKFSYMYHG